MTALDRWIFTAYRPTPEGLGAYRIGYALFVLLVMAPGHTLALDFTRISSFPSAFFVPPPGPMMLAPGFPPAWFFTALLLGIHLAAAALLLGYRTRLASVALTLLLLVGYGFSYSFGKINHSLLYVLVPPVMAAAGWGAALSADRQRRPEASPAVRAWPLSLLALLVGFLMFTAGFPKLLGGWLDPSTQAVQSHLFTHFFVNGRQDLLAPLFLRLDAPWLWEMLDVATVIFEIGFLWAAFRPAAMRIFCAIAVLFHFSVMLMLNIPFTENLIAYAAFFSWAGLVPAWPRAARWLRRPAAAPLAAGALGLLTFSFGSPLHALDARVPFVSGLLLHEVVVLTLAAALALGFLLRAGLGRLPARLRPQPTA